MLFFPFQQGVLGTIIVNDEGEPIRSTTICEPDGTPVTDQVRIEQAANLQDHPTI